MQAVVHHRAHPSLCTLRTGLAGMLSARVGSIPISYIACNSVLTVSSLSPRPDTKLSCDRNHDWHDHDFGRA